MVVGMMVRDKLKGVGMVVEDKLKSEGEGMVMVDMFLNFVGMKDREMGQGRLSLVMGQGRLLLVMDKALQTLVEVLGIVFGVQEVLHTVVLMVHSLFLVSAMPNNAKHDKFIILHNSQKKFIVFNH